MRRVDMSRAEDLLERLEAPFWKAVFHSKPSYHDKTHASPAVRQGPRFRIPQGVKVVLWVIGGLGLLIWLLVYSLYSNTPTFPGAGG